MVERRRLLLPHIEPRARGRLVVIGLPPSADLVGAVHAWAGSPPAVRSTTPGVQTALFRRAAKPDQLFLIAANMTGADTLAPISLAPTFLGPRVTITDLFDGWSRTSPRDDAIIKLSRASGSVFRLQPA